MTELDTQRLGEYLLGHLDSQEQQELEKELAGSAEARAQLQALEHTLEALALDVEPVTPSAGLKSRILDSLSPATRFEGFVERLVDLFDLSGEVVREHLAVVSEAPDGHWKRSPTPGVYLLHFDGGPRVAGAHCGLVYVEAGQALPSHRHAGREQMLVIDGCALENGARLLAPGDLVESGPGSAHSVRVLNDSPMVFAVVLDGVLSG